jgi:hypothetical protein
MNKYFQVSDRLKVYQGWVPHLGALWAARLCFCA